MKIVSYNTTYSFIVTSLYNSFIVTSLYNSFYISYDRYFDKYTISELILHHPEKKHVWYGLRFHKVYE